MAAVSQTYVSIHSRLLSSLRRAALTMIVAALLLAGFIPHIIGATAACAADTPPAATLSRQDAEQLLSVLNDPRKREDFTHTLSLMAKGLPPAAAPASAGGVITPVINSHNINSELSSVSQTLKQYTYNFIGLFEDLGFVGSWFHSEISHSDTRKTLVDAFSRAGFIAIAAIVLEHFISIFLRKRLISFTKMAEKQQNQKREKAAAEYAAEATGTDGADTRAKDQKHRDQVLSYLSRTPYTLMHLLLKMVPVLAALLTGYLGGIFLTVSSQGRTVTFTLVTAYILARVLYLLLETALAPRSPAIRLIPVSSTTAHMLTRWWMALVAVPALIICLSTLGSEFDLPARGEQAMLRGVILVMHLIIAAFIWRVRNIVAATLQPSAEKKKRAFWSFIGTLANFWWIPVLFLDIALWFIWAAHLKGGYQWILHGLLMTLLCLALSRLAAVLIYGGQDRLFHISAEMEASHPGLQKRADYYYPFVRRILTFFIVFATCVFLAQSWGIPGVYFFTQSTVGSRLLSAILMLTIGLTVASLAWELINGLLNKQIDRYTAQQQSSRATRLRTVLPIIRTVLLVIIVIIVAVTTLSQIGINVTPLLTGAGILGVGLSFGSQSLWKDVITGFFMLAENAIQVGDWVTASGVSGTVEHLSIRTLRVRSFDGDLHIIPFSSVTSIANTGKGFNQIIVRQTLTLAEDSTRVAAIMAGVIKEMRTEDAFKSIIFSDYNDLGVDCSDSNGAVLLGTIRTAPMMKWKVQREFYRRLAKLMADEDVQFYTPTSYYTTPPDTAMHLAVDAFPDAFTPRAGTLPATNTDTPVHTPDETGHQKPEGKN